MNTEKQAQSALSAQPVEQWQQTSLAKPMDQMQQTSLAKPVEQWQQTSLAKPMEQWQQVILCRAYGDFIIALEAASRSKQVLNQDQALVPPEQTKQGNFHLVASTHLKPLYDAIPAAFKNPHLSIEFVNWGIKGSLMRIFTNKYVFHPNTILELRSLKNWLQQQSITNEFVLEHALRKNWIQWFTGKKFSHIVDGGNVYEQYELFFNAQPKSYEHSIDKINGNNLAKAITNANESTIVNTNTNTNTSTSASTSANTNDRYNVLILPTARLKFRNIPSDICNRIKVKHANQAHQVQVAYYQQLPQDQGNDQHPQNLHPQNLHQQELHIQELHNQQQTHSEVNDSAIASDIIVYHNFNTLVQLILQANYIYCPDSLSAHLANFFGKPHFILYPAHLPKDFLTPYAIKYHTHGSFNEFQ